MAFFTDSRACIQQNCESSKSRFSLVKHNLLSINILQLTYKIRRCGPSSFPMTSHGNWIKTKLTLTQHWIYTTTVVLVLIESRHVEFSQKQKVFRFFVNECEWIKCELHAYDFDWSQQFHSHQWWVTIFLQLIIIIIILERFN